MSLVDPVEQLFASFASANRAIWPLQIPWRDRPSLRQRPLAGLMLAVAIAATGHDDILMGLGLVFLIVSSTFAHDIKKRTASHMRYIR